MGDRDKLTDLIGLVYEAILRPDHWDVFVESFARALKANCAHLQVFDWDRQEPLAFSEWQTDPGAMHAYYDHYIATDIWLQAPHIPGEPVRSGTLVEASTFERSEFYNDFLRELDIYHLCGFVDGPANGIQTSLSFHRPRRAENFTCEDLALTAALAPHVNRAARIAHQVDALREMLGQSNEAMDRVSFGIVALDDTGYVREMNRSAVEILGRDDGLTIDACRTLQAVLPAEQRRLEHAVAAAIRRDSGRLNVASEAAIIGITRRGNHRPYAVQVVPITTDCADATGRRPGALIFIGDPASCHRHPITPVAKIYGLTPAESRLAELLCVGATISKAAERLGVTQGTARTRLKHIFHKTGCHSQAELMRLVMSSSGWTE